ncbi:hypothetical protein NQ317_002888 [Molorchus minor]|uniref:Essential protein Yae1 N-terminal domain-containing protein n=1 Tax=Molorchus minor TaxID=1323400 RepID=A0ABQ9JSS4_9CUCU|nr:hypothetical protein NQ317_002888 [Molorchus minor]
MEAQREEFVEIKQSWRKIEYVSKKVGLREGILDGRDTNFQEHFDIGYKEGFQNGYALGKYKGSLLAYSRQHFLGLLTNSLLEKVSRGRCEICRHEELLNEGVSEIIRRQTELSNNDFKELDSTLHNVFTNNLTKELF